MYFTNLISRQEQDILLQLGLENSLEDIKAEFKKWQQGGDENIKKIIKAQILAMLETAEQNLELIQTKQTSNKLNYLWGIPQGAQFIDLRIKSAELTASLNFPGYSVGGVANGGEPEEIMYKQVLSQTEVLEEDKPRHLLGVGTPKDIVQMVARGIDLFDCVYPTRGARHGSIFFEADEFSYRQVQIANSSFKTDNSPISINSNIPELREYTKGYLSHLIRCKEILGYRLATLQNLDFYFRLMQSIRSKLADGSFEVFVRKYKRI